MGLFDRLARRPQQPSQSEPSADQASSAAPELLPDAPSTSRPEVLSDPVPSFSSSSSPSFNPYEDLNTALSRRGQQPLFQPPKEPEFLFTEEAAIRTRSWSENLTYYTGTGYLAGAMVGGGRGALEAVKSKPELGVDTLRLRVNRLLNLSGRTGRTAGNALGVLGLLFASFESGLGYLGEDYSVPRELITVGAGFGTAALYRSTRGPKAAAIAGAVGAVAATALLGGRRYINPGL